MCGIDGLGQAEWTKPHVLFYQDDIRLGADVALTLRVPNPRVATWPTSYRYVRMSLLWPLSLAEMDCPQRQHFIANKSNQKMAFVGHCYRGSHVGRHIVGHA